MKSNSRTQYNNIIMDTSKFIHVHVLLHVLSQA